MPKKLTPKQAQNKTAATLLRSCLYMYRLLMEGKHEPYEAKHFQKMMDYAIASRDVKAAEKKRKTR